MRSGARHRRLRHHPMSYSSNQVQLAALPSLNLLRREEYRLWKLSSVFDCFTGVGQRPMVEWTAHRLRLCSCVGAGRVCVRRQLGRDYYLVAPYYYLRWQQPRLIYSVASRGGCASLTAQQPLLHQSYELLPFAA